MRKGERVRVDGKKVCVGPSFIVFHGREKLKQQSCLTHHTSK